MSSRSHHPKRGRMKKLFVSIFLSVSAMYFSTGQVLSDDRPQIQVNFSFQGDLFDGLSVEDRAAIASNVEDKICTMAENEWGYLDWIHGMPASADAAQWNVVLSVDIRPVTKDNGETSAAFIGTLEHSGLRDAKEFTFEQTEENKTIYPMGRVVPFQDPNALEDDIFRQLDKQLGGLLKHPHVEGYLQKIPIAEEVIADPANTRLLVPVQFSDLRTRNDSELEVTFFRPGQEEGVLKLLTAKGVAEEGQHKGYVQGVATFLWLDPLIFPLPTGWDNELVTIVGSATDVKVYMLSYSPSLAGSSTTDDDLVTEPDM